MRTLAALLLLTAVQLNAQPALHIDISGEWRMQRGDDPTYASPSIDDASWVKVELPWTKAIVRENSWLRRQVTIPDWADKSQLVLTLGTISNVYEVYVNGIKIGATGAFSLEAQQIARPRSFPIPATVASQNNPMTIAVRTWHSRLRGGSTSWEVFAEGPYLITDPSGVDPNWPAAAINKRTLRQTPDLVTAAAQLALALMLIIAWVAERKRLELLLLAMYLLVEIIYSTALTLAVGIDTYPWQWGTAMGIGITLRASIFASFCLRSLDFKSRWLYALVWFLAAGMSANPVSVDRPFFFVLAAMTLGIIAYGWWRLARHGTTAEHNIFAVLLLVVLAAQTNRYGSSLGVSNRMVIGRYAWSIHEVMVWVLAFLIALLLLRRLIADRREKLRLAGELEAARVIQQLLLKAPAMREPGLSIEAVYEPAQEVGGDFYYVLDGQLVVLGDVSGKGLKAAMLVTLLIGVLRNTKERRPAAVLAELNNAVAGQIDGFVTCCCARFAADGMVTVANAGHLFPYSEGAAIEVETGLPLGLDAEAVYAETSVVLAKGASITLLSDGVLEAANPKGELFGFDRTGAISTKTVAAIAEEAKAWGQNDDITLVRVWRSA